jgi:hypothetical protein
MTAAKTSCPLEGLGIERTRARRERRVVHRDEGRRRRGFAQARIQPREAPGIELTMRSPRANGVERDQTDRTRLDDVAERSRTR